jgi:TonB family protein
VLEKIKYADRHPSEDADARRRGIQSETHARIDDETTVDLMRQRAESIDAARLRFVQTLAGDFAHDAPLVLKLACDGERGLPAVLPTTFARAALNQKGRVEVKITEVEGDYVPDKPEQKPVTAPQQQPGPGQKPAATPPPSAPSKSQITGGVLNDKAVEMPKPEYPEAAKQAGITGVVKVDVTIDETGKVIKAVATDGPKELRQAAVEAALKARFEPVRLHGGLIKVQGVLTYKF